jgi:hypothetical protein
VMATAEIPEPLPHNVVIELARLRALASRRSTRPWAPIPLPNPRRRWWSRGRRRGHVGHGTVKTMASRGIEAIELCRWRREGARFDLDFQEVKDAVLFVSLEMSARQLAQRAAADLCFDGHRGIYYGDIVDRKLTNEQARQVARATHGSSRCRSRSSMRRA